MNTLYWLTVLGKLGDLFPAIMIITSILLIIIGIGSLIFHVENEENAPLLTKATLFCFFTLVTLGLISLFVPTKKELYIIYGVGSAVDYIKDNPDAKQLPTKCIETIDKWAESLSDNNNKQDEQ